MKADGNEAETRRRVERIFELVMGYSAFDHLSRERAVKGAGETEHVDFAVQLESGPDAEPLMMVELKRVGVDLALKHLKQVTSYAIDSGCEWVLLTNSRDWRLYHVAFGQPPKTQLIEHWNLLTDDIGELAHKFDVISYKQVKRGSLKKLWEKATVLSANSLLGALAGEDSMRVLRRVLRKNTGVMVEPDDVVNGIRKLLNENAAIELSKIKTDSAEGRKRPIRAVKGKKANQGAQAVSTGGKNPVMVAAGKKAALTRATASYTFDEHLAGKPDNIKNLAIDMREYITGLDPSIEEKAKKFYVAYKTSQNFACMEIQKQKVVLFLRLDPRSITDVPEIGRDVSNIGHFGTGDFELTIKTATDFEMAKAYIEMAHQEMSG
jgi:predicted transport protein